MSSRFWSQTRLVLLFIVAALITQSIYFRLTDNYARFAQRMVRERGLTIDVSELRWGFPAELRFSQLGFLAPIGGLPIPFFIDSGSLGFEVLDAFLGNATTNLAAKLYGGDLRTTAQRSLFGAFPLVFKSDASEIDLANHPIGKNFGLSGKLTFSASGKIGSQGDLDSLDANIHVANLALAGSQKLYGFIALPHFSNGDLIARGTLFNEKASIPKMKFESTLGTASGSCSAVVLAGGFIDRGNCEFQAELSESGVRDIGGYLMLGAPGATPGTKDWGISVRMERGRVVQVKTTPHSMEK